MFICSDAQVNSLQPSGAFVQSLVARSFLVTAGRPPSRLLVFPANTLSLIAKPSFIPFPLHLQASSFLEFVLVEGGCQGYLFFDLLHSLLPSFNSFLASSLFF